MIKVVSTTEYKGFVVSEHKGEDPHDSHLRTLRMHYFTVDELFGNKAFSELSDANKAIDEHVSK